MSPKLILALLLASLGILSTAHAQTMRNPTRAKLLYETHCVVCHNEQIHWRDKKIAANWNALKAQVGRWQGISSLNWEDDDVVSVTQYLNGLYYHYPAPD